MRHGLKLLIDSQSDMRVIGEAADGHSVIQQAEKLNPDVVVMDISMPGLNGLVATRKLQGTRPGLTIVALTRHDDQTYLKDLLRAGASGYVLKQSAPMEFVRAIRAAAAGGVFLDPAMTSRVADGLLAGRAKVAVQSSDDISDRESDVLRLTAVGNSNKEIAAQLGISVKTVEVHKANAMRKLGLTGRVDIIRYAVLQGWLYDT